MTNTLKHQPVSWLRASKLPMFLVLAIMVPSISRSFGQNMPQLSVGPLQLAFGQIQDGSSYQALFLIQHTLNSPSASGTVTIDNPAFQIISGGTFALSGSDADVVEILFSPTSVASYTGTATITSTATFAGPNTVTLTGTGAMPPPNGGAVHVNATIDGVPWVGSLDYALTGLTNFVGDTVPADFENRPASPYNLTVGSGGPRASFFLSVTPSHAQTLQAGSLATFTINFTSNPMLSPLGNTLLGALNIGFGTKASFLYVLEFSESLTTPAWAPVLQVLGSDAAVVVTPTPPASQTGYYRVHVQNPQGFLSFPLKGFSPYTAEISAVFDHSNPTDCPDGMVVAYTGETGSSTFGHSIWSIMGQSSTCSSEIVYGLPKAPLADKQKFVVNGHYTGGAPNLPDGANSPLFLFYDGHTGFDYPVPSGTPVFAAADGTVTLVGPDTTDTLDPNPTEVVIQHANGYSTYYLDMATASVAMGASVIEGTTQIGTIGNEGHLHFTVKTKNDVRVDPYGWTGAQGTDPWPIDGQDNVPLWRDVP